MITDPTIQQIDEQFQNAVKISHILLQTLNEVTTACDYVPGEPVSDLKDRIRKIVQLGLMSVKEHMSRTHVKM
jgi:hypothetical protein